MSAEFQARAMDIAMPIVLILAGCCANAFIYEILVKENATHGCHFTLAQFCAVALQGLVNNVEGRSTWNWLSVELKSRLLPLSVYCWMCVLFLISSTAPNFAILASISVPLMQVLSSSRMVFTIVTGFTFFGVNYNIWTVVAVAVVTWGTIMVTVEEVFGCDGHNIYSCAGGDVLRELHSPDENTLELSQLTLQRVQELIPLDTLTTSSWFSSEQVLLRVIGTAVMVVGLLVGAILGHFQARVFKFAGQNREGLEKELSFYVHSLSMPILLVQCVSLQALFSATTTEAIGVKSDKNIQSAMSCGYYYALLILTGVTQCLCIHGVYRLLAVTSSLTLNLVLTLRKVVSILLSVYWFNNWFNFAQWGGLALIMIGTILYVTSPLVTSAATSESKHLAKALDTKSCKTLRNLSEASEPLLRESESVNKSQHAAIRKRRKAEP